MIPQRKGASYPVIQGMLLCAFAVIYYFDKSARLIAAPWAAVAGIVLCVLGLILMSTAIVSLGPTLRVSPEPKAGGRLITAGPYRKMRHPIYTGIILLVGGVFLRKPTLPVLVAAAIIAAVLHMKSAYEEQLLGEKYPDYADYKARTFGIFPGIR